MRGLGRGGIAALAVLLALALAPAARGAAGWALDPPSWDFGLRAPGTPQPAKTFDLVNTGDVDLTPVFVSVAGSDGAGFSIAQNQCGKLVPGASCGISIGFDPTSPGPKDGELQVAAQGGLVGPATAQLTGAGAGVIASIAPSQEVFDRLQVGAVSPARTLLLRNEGTVSITITLAAITPVAGSPFLAFDSDQFRLLGGSCAAGRVVEPGAGCTLEVAFAPTRPGNMEAELAVATAEPGSPYVARLFGGTLPSSSPLLPPMIMFGPSATIVRGPPRVTRARHAAFWLSGSVGTSKFACKLDADEFELCESPSRYRRLRPGRHRFSVRAFDSEWRWGTPVTYRWRVLPERRSG